MERLRRAKRTVFCGMPPQKAAMVFGIICFVAAIVGIVCSAFRPSGAPGYMNIGYAWCGLVLITAILAIVAYLFLVRQWRINVSILYIIVLNLNGIDVLFGFLCLIFVVVGWVLCSSYASGFGALCTVVFIFALLITFAELALYCAFEWCLWLACLEQKDQENQRCGGVVVAPNPAPAAMPPPTANPSAQVVVVV
ncbi:hypothetical protein DdX_11992 [Ditylenchus destructor]|uniref:MARVEL domain-containing protein n=1 Tax=Ditylenchus destructor TaxID=166010 RepID=A0AAD4MW26_9BILA|nr:hypothetical protein DdX_11992 [Ditylenchus destructor]